MCLSLITYIAKRGLNLDNWLTDEQAATAQLLGKSLDEEITQIAHKSWYNLSTLLGDKSYSFGDKMCTFDATAFAMLSGFTLSSLETELGEQAKIHTNLVDFTKRIASAYYPEHVELS